MIIKRHRVTDFRNLGEVSIDFGPGVTVISGKNGQGKTNLLESVWLQTGARSFRSGGDEVFIKKGRSFAIAESDFFSRGMEVNYRLTISDNGRMISRNGGNPQKASAMAGSFFCVVFSPDQLELVKGSPEKRRRFIDTALGQLYPAYITALRNYNRLLVQKNSLLKDCYSVSAALDMLDVFDISLSAAAAEITGYRRRFVDALRPAALEYYRRISDNKETPEFTYKSTVFDGEENAGRAAECFAECRGDDLRARCCTKGPHRDDLVITLNKEDTRLFSSQGQQRSIVLSLKLAEADCFEKITEEKPLLLLDDVLSELDGERQDLLINCVRESQAIITGCDEATIAAKTDCRIYKINEGALIQ